MTRAGTTAGEHQGSTSRAALTRDGGGGHLRRARGAPVLLLSHARVTRVWCAPQCGLDESRDEADDDALVIMDIYGE
jgi:hypothetical protein